MIQLVKINLETGLLVEDVLLDEIPMSDTWLQDADGNPVLPDGIDQPRYIPDPAYIATPCPGGFWWPRWDGAQWVEGGQAPAPALPEPTLDERNRADIDYLAMVMEVEL